MEALFLKLVNMSITASWLVLAIIAVRFLFKKTPKWILCLLWGLVAFRLICPFSIESSLSLIPDSEPLSQETIYASETIKQAHGDILDSEGSVLVSRVPAARGEILDSEGNVIVEKPLTVPDAEPGLRWTSVLSKIWMAGVIAMLSYSLVSYHLLKQKVSTAIPLKRGIKQSEYVDSPFVLGIIRPVIYLPFGMAEEDMSYVIAHEKAHIRRRDHWWKPLGFLLLSIYWFNPMLWVAYILLCRDIEAACDEKVIKDMETEERRAYSTALLNCSIHRRRIAACPLAFGEVGVKQRVMGVMNYKKPAFWMVLIALIICIVVAVCFLTNPKPEEDVDSGYEEMDPGYDRIQAVTSQDGYRILSQESVKVNLVIEKAKLPEDCVSLKGHDFEARELIPYQTFADNVLYLKHVGIDEERSEYLRFTFAFQTDALEKESLLLPYHVDIEGNGYVCNVEVNRGEVWDNQGTFENAAYFEPVINGEGFCVLVKKAIYEAAGHHIAFMLNDMNRLYYEVQQIQTPVTISLENVTPSGARILFHQDESRINGSLLCSHDYFLQQKVDGKWVDLPAQPNPHKDQTYDIALLHHHGVDWEGTYGKLEVGSYRLGKVIPITSGENPEYATVYAEFTVDNVYTWFDNYSDDGSELYPKDAVVDLFGMEGTSLSYGSRMEKEILQVNAQGSQPIISCDVMIRNVFLTDLSGDGISEVCATVQMEDGMHVRIYDPAEKKTHELPFEENRFYVLTKKADRLCVLEQDASWLITGYGQLAITDGELEIRELDPQVRALQEKLVCIDVQTRKAVCLSGSKEVTDALSVLKDLKDQVQPASAEELEAAREDVFYRSRITLNYELGERTLYFSGDFKILWEAGSEEGYKIADPEPILQLVASVTDGVQGKETSGEPFASADAPWDWCAGISSNAISFAHAHVCLYTYSYGNSSGSSSTMGVISQDTLEKLMGVLNEVPREAFTEEKMLGGKTFHALHYNQQEQNSSVALIDGVNDLGVVIGYQDGKVTMLLTDEMEKVKEEDMSYLEPTRLWSVQDENLQRFMRSVTENPPVITYFAGAEYQWQDAVEFSSGDFLLSLRLIEGWEWERVTNPTNSGIRCRPEEVNEGWLYFSFWPGGYAPVEEGRYISESIYYNWPHYTSYPADVKTPTTFSTVGRTWSYQKYALEIGDYAIINDGADAWFPDYLDEISDILTLSNFVVSE